MGKIGQPYDYEAWICDSLTGTGLVKLPFSVCTWQRVRSDFSTATVTVPYADGGIDCCSTINGLYAWEQMVKVFRNNHLVWDGPVTGWGVTDTGTLEVRAHDRSVIAAKRIVGVDRLYTQSDLWDIVRQVLSDASIGDTNYDPYPFTVSPASTDVGLLIDREYRADRLERVDSVLADLVSTAGLFWTQIGETFYLDAQQFYSYSGANGNYIDPVISERTVFGPVALSVDGLDVSTAVYVGRDGQGLAGFANYATSTDTTYTSSLLQLGIADGQTLADTQLGTVSAAELLAARQATPTVTLEKIKLRPEFGSPTFTDNLFYLTPGAHFPVDFPHTCAFNVPIVTIDPLDFETFFTSDTIEKVRLDQLDVTVTASADGYTEVFLGSFVAVADP